MGSLALDTSLQYLKGVGPRRAEVLATEGIHNVFDLLFYAPHSHIHRSSMRSLSQLRSHLAYSSVSSLSSSEGIDALRTETTVVAHIQSMQTRTIGKRKSMLSVILTDESDASAEVVFWNYVEYYKKALKPGALYAISGTAEINRYGRLTFHHPEFEQLEDEDELLYRQGRILPKYRVTKAMKTAGLTIRHLRLMMEQALSDIGSKIPECLPEHWLKHFAYPSRHEALSTLHFPESLERLHLAQQRMKFEELFYFELMLAMHSHASAIKDKAPRIQPPSPSARHVRDALSFQLTGAQNRVLHQILKDMGSDQPMNRLLQGDVGSGKTIVALLSMLMAVDNGYQALLLAPTEILAEQHYQNIKRYCAGLGTPVVQIVGGQSKKQRHDISTTLQEQGAALIVGTHALFGGSSKRSAVARTLPYKNVGLIVIDEQHRFGVLQRAQLRSLGMQSFPENQPLAPHLLLMSATPIPRTLSMTAYGDLHLSVIDELPPNRTPVKTHVVFESRLAECYEFIRAQLREGRQAYIVFPLVEESEKLDLKAATQAFEELQHGDFGEFRCTLLHGQMFWYEKEEAMQAFLRKEFDVLVATTVIEVGIDVPNASVMMIHNAERFGLSQLHQLRGRVGRGSHASYCFLATKDHFSFLLRRKEADHSEKLSAVVRLRTMEQTNDGFRIAEVDLTLRGPGDVLGTRQSGVPNFRFADIVADADLIALAREQAFGLVNSDPQLRKPEHALVRTEYARVSRIAGSVPTTA